MLLPSTISRPATARVQHFLDSVYYLDDPRTGVEDADRAFLADVAKAMDADACLSGRSWSFFVNAPYVTSHGIFTEVLSAACNIHRDAPLSRRLGLLRDLLITTLPGKTDDAYRIFPGIYDGPSKRVIRGVSSEDKILVLAAFAARLGRPGQPLTALHPSRLTEDFVPFASIATVETILTLH